MRLRWVSGGVGVAMMLACSGLGSPELCAMYDDVGPAGVPVHADWTWTTPSEELGAVACRSEDSGVTFEVPGTDLTPFFEQVDLAKADGWELVHVHDGSEYGSMDAFLGQDDRLIEISMMSRPGWGVSDLRFSTATPYDIRASRLQEADPDCVRPCSERMMSCRDACNYESSCLERCDAEGNACEDGCL